MDQFGDYYNQFLLGDNDAFEKIIDEYKNGLIFYINQHIHDYMMAEELTEDVFVELVIKRPKFLGQSKFKTWLYRIAHNKAVSYIRKSNRLTSLEQDKVVIVDELVDIEHEYIEKVVRVENSGSVQKALRNIEPQYEQVLYLHYYEEFDTVQISKIMKKSKKQIGNLLYRAKQSLKKELEKEGYIYEE